MLTDSEEAEADDKIVIRVDFGRDLDAVATGHLDKHASSQLEPQITLLGMVLQTPEDWRKP